MIDLGRRRLGNTGGCAFAGALLRVAETDGEVVEQPIDGELQSLHASDFLNQPAALLRKPEGAFLPNSAGWTIYKRVQ